MSSTNYNVLILAVALSLFVLAVKGSPAPNTATAMEKYINEWKAVDAVRSSRTSLASNITILAQEESVTVKNLEGYRTWNAQEIFNAQIWAKYSAAAYCLLDAPIRNWNCLFHCRNGTEGTRVRRVFNTALTNTRGFVATNPNLNAIVVSFRGSLSPTNFVTNLVRNLVPLRTNVGVQNLNVHLGYQNTFEAVRGLVIGEVRAALQENPNFKVYVTGHSLGGAVANLAILAIKQELNLPDDKLALYNYGTPRMGDERFADFLTSQKFEQFRILNKRDDPPIDPPRGRYKHSSTEVWFTNGKAYVCDKTLPNEDPNCSLSIGRNVNLLDHLLIFDNVPFGPNC
ncbi:Alpha/Beta hydrolase protein [Paraphysoderma sedebokerense]|nr:Alpha/Beta hydrolase protein [Paraphysoderma sedebokerense]